MSTTVLTEVRDGVLLITLNRPEKRNAIDRSIMVGVGEALDRLDAEDDLAVGVLTGAGGTFCAGMDLKAFTEGAMGPGAGGPAPTRRARKPVIAAVEGWAVAGGCELALGCDLIVASREAKFGLPEVKRSLIAAGGGLHRLAIALPFQVAMEVALTGDPLTAETAFRHGLVNELTEPGDAVAGAMALAARIVPNGPLAVALTKELVSSYAGWTDDRAAPFQERINAVFASADAMEGAKAFTEKRSPVWQGK